MIDTIHLAYSLEVFRPPLALEKEQVISVVFLLLSPCPQITVDFQNFGNCFTHCSGTRNVFLPFSWSLPNCGDDHLTAMVSGGPSAFTTETEHSCNTWPPNTKTQLWQTLNIQQWEKSIRSAELPRGARETEGNLAGVQENRCVIYIRENVTKRIGRRWLGGQICGISTKISQVQTNWLCRYVVN